MSASLDTRVETRAGATSAPLVFPPPTAGRRSGACSRPGHGRARNEDALALVEAAGLYVVADGMGGHAHGDRVAQCAVRELSAALPTALGPKPARETAAMCAAIEDALVALGARLSSRYPDGGTTLVAAYHRGTRCFIAHLGDSRAYRFRRGHLRTLTRDHTVVQRLLDFGIVDDLAARRHPDRGALTRYLGLGRRADPEVRCVRVRPADRFVLCTDGVHTVLPDPAIERVLAAHDDPGDASRALVELVASRSGRDDATVLVFDGSAA
ncbi:MAG: protein phosphatase 2C domain-containing protein [Myxococcota bacterium]